MPTTSARPTLATFLARRAWTLRFPHEGILGQSAQAKAAAMNATIGIALTDDGSPMHLESVARNVRLVPSEVFPYAGSFGVPALRDAWLRLMRAKNPSFPASCSLPIVAAGITHALSIAFHLFADEECPVLVPSPGWDNYRLIASTAGAGITEQYGVLCDDAFDLQGLREVLSRHRRACVVLNFPLNPTGTVPSHAQAKEIASLFTEAAERGGRYTVIVDDAYAGFVFDADAYPESLFCLLAHAHPNLLAVKADGASKEDFAWGLRVAFLTFAGRALEQEDLRQLEDKAAAVVRGGVSNVCLLSQQLLLHAYASPALDRERRQQRAVLERRYHLAWAMANKREYQEVFTVLPCQGGYFLCIRPVGADAETIRRHLLADEGVGVIAVEGLLRIAFSSLAEADIPRVFERIARTISSRSSYANTHSERP